MNSELVYARLTRGRVQLTFQAEEMSTGPTGTCLTKRLKLASGFPGRSARHSSAMSIMCSARRRAVLISPAGKRIGRPICKVTSLARVSMLASMWSNAFLTNALRSSRVVLRHDSKATLEAATILVASWREWPGCSKITSWVAGEIVRTALDILKWYLCQFKREAGCLLWESVHDEGKWRLLYVELCLSRSPAVPYRLIALIVATREAACLRCL